MVEREPLLVELSSPMLCCLDSGVLSARFGYGDEPELQPEAIWAWSLLQHAVEARRPVNYKRRWQTRPA